MSITPPTGQSVSASPAAPVVPVVRRRSVARIALRVLVVVAVVVVVLAALVGTTSVWFVQRTLPQTTGTLNVKGLHDRVSVLRDSWGVPHITANDLHDVSFAEGYVTAQDRLFQMEFNRRVAQGRLAEMFGAGADNSILDTDILLRTLDLYGAARFEEANLDSRTLTLLTAYADGVNAFLDSHQNSLPLEFTILGITPQKWTPLDSLAYGRVVSLSLDSAWGTKYSRAMVINKVGPLVASALFPQYPDDNPTLFASQNTAAPPVESGVGGAAATTNNTLEPTQALSPNLLKGTAFLRQILGDVHDALGSNDWVVDGTHTVTGKPLLANDPHLGIRMPSIWYEIGLRGGGLDEIGFTFPGEPGIVIGHNDYIAWGVTNVGADNTDLYLERLDPANHPGQYLYDRTWQPLESRQQVIHIRGGGSKTITINTTIHGPIINSGLDDLKKYPPVALKWTALQSSYSFRGFFQLNFARNWTEFLDAIENISISQNFVYADIYGNIGYRMSGVLPIRPASNRLLPVAGSTSDHEWQGYVPQNEMPTLYNPDTHIIATANNRIVPDDYPVYVTSDWDCGYRARRIDNLLTGKAKLSLSDFQQIQADVYSIPASQIVPAFIRVGQAAGGDAAKAAGLLQNWDYQMTRNSSAAAVYEVAAGNMLRETVEPMLGKDLYNIFQSNATPSCLFTTLANSINTPMPLYASSQLRDAAIARALADTVHTLRARFGDDTSKWQWGTLHTAHFEHPLATVKPLNLIFDIAPVTRPGDSTTINVGGSGRFSDDPANYAQRSVPSMRQIIDLSNFDNSVWVTTTGESGQPFSAHYSDLVPVWDQNHYQAMRYTPSAIAKDNQELLIMQPEK
jgi:penicillin G amidase